MILMALALAAQPLCADPDQSRECRRRADRYAYKVCGPEGTVDWDNYPDKPSCNRTGWDGHRYRALPEADGKR